MPLISPCPPRSVLSTWEQTKIELTGLAQARKHEGGDPGPKMKEGRKMMLQEGPSIRTTTTLMVAGGPRAAVPPQATFPPDFYSQVPVDTRTLAKVEHAQA